MAEEYRQRLDQFSEQTEDGHHLSDVDLEPIISLLEPTPQVFDWVETFLRWLQSFFKSEQALDLSFLETAAKFIAEYAIYTYYFLYGVLLLAFVLLVWQLAQHLKQITLPARKGAGPPRVMLAPTQSRSDLSGLTGKSRLIALFRNALYLLQDREILANVDTSTHRELALQLESGVSVLHPEFRQLYPFMDPLIYSHIEIEPEAQNDVEMRIARLTESSNE